MRERARAICNAPTAEATARWKRIDKSGEARDGAVSDQPPRIDGEAGRRVCFQGY
jgi:hypothetical protein